MTGIILALRKAGYYFGMMIGEDHDVILRRLRR
jgi:hypothetical protein